MRTLTDIFLYLTKRLYPTGRTFLIPINSWILSVHKALIVSEQEVYEAVLGTLNSILPDNDEFTEQDASDWERRLGIIRSEGLTLEERKAAIKRKYAAPGDIPARQHYLYVEGQLQSAGFDVYVHENRPVAEPPSAYPGFTSSIGTSLGSFQLGQKGLGASTINLCANHISEKQDSQYSIGSDYRNLFFIGGLTKGDATTIPLNRKDEFRQLILQLKPNQCVAILFINYV